MTTAELNRDINRLNKSIKNFKGTNDEYYSFIEEVAKPEFRRLYLSDREFKYMNRKSILIMLRLNLRHRFEPLHMYGIHINI